MHVCHDGVKPAKIIGGTLGGSLRALATVEPASVCTVNTSQPEWEEIDFAVDSGASETVVAEHMVVNALTKPSAASVRGVSYEVANGETIPNLGEKHIMCVSHEEGLRKTITAQVCDVSKPLLSVHKLVQAGHTVVFSPQASYIQSADTQDTLWLRENGGMFKLKVWVPKNPTDVGF